MLSVLLPSPWFPTQDRHMHWNLTPWLRYVIRWALLCPLCLNGNVIIDFKDWDVYLNLDNDNYGNAGVSDDDFDPKAGDKPRKNASKTAKKAAVEVVRKEVHTLQENHEHLLSASFDLSFANNSGPGQDLEPSSSHVDGGFDFFFPLSDGFGLSEGPGIGDDLARELGWNISPAKTACSKGCVGLV